MLASRTRNKVPFSHRASGESKLSDPKGISDSLTDKRKRLQGTRSSSAEGKRKGSCYRNRFNFSLRLAAERLSFALPRHADGDQSAQTELHS